MKKHLLMPIQFITGSQHKFAEISAVLGDGAIEQLDIDLPEIQEINPRLIIEAKLQEAAGRYPDQQLIVEDTSLFMECLNANPETVPGLPGPLIKWFMKSLGREGLWELADRFGLYGAEARTTIGYTDGRSEILFFEGSTFGEIVAPRGDSDFGWDPVFQPHDHRQTYAEMTREQKNAISHRGKAAAALKQFLEQPPVTGVGE